MAKLNLEFCYIRAPISGRISRKNVTADNLVQPKHRVGWCAHDHRRRRPPLRLSGTWMRTRCSITSSSTRKASSPAPAISTARFPRSAERARIPARRFHGVRGQPRRSRHGHDARARQWKNWNPSLTPGFFVRVRIAASPQLQDYSSCPTRPSARTRSRNTRRSRRPRSSSPYSTRH